MRVVGVVRCTDTWSADGCDQRAVDIMDRVAVGELISDVRPEFVVHLAAAKSRVLDLDVFRTDYQVNLLGTLNLAQACLVAECGSRFVHLGTCDEYGHCAVPFDETSRETPVSAYGVSKLASTHLLQALARTRDFPAVILRPTNVYGPGQTTDMLLPALIQALTRGEEFPMTRGQQTRDYVYVDDLVDAIVKSLLGKVAAGTVVNISSAAPVQVRDVALMAAQTIGPRASSLLSFGARDYRPGEVMEYWASNARAAELLGWLPRVSLEQGIAWTVANVRRTTGAS